MDKEFDLMCPSNRIGAVDLFVVSHHGSSTSNSAALVNAIEPRVAIMNNGPAKGGPPEAMKSRNGLSKTYAARAAGAAR